MCDNASGTKTWRANFGQDSTFAGVITAGGNADDNGVGDFKYAPPSGYLALCTANLPEPVVGPLGDSLSGDNMNTVLWTGDGAAPRSITGVGFQPDWVWIKGRNATWDHHSIDVIRGANNYLKSSSTAAEASSGAGNEIISSFDSDGFSLATSSVNGNSNNSGSTYVGWNWKAGGTASSNTDGSITSSVSANTDAGFSVVTYSGNGSSSATVGHGLGVAPSMLIVKRRDTSGYGWNVYHSAIGASKVLFLNSTAAEASTSLWNSTAPTSSVFSLGTSSGANASGGTYVGYCFADVDGYSKAGSYTGNGSTDGAFVYTGFRPAWILIRLYDNGGTNWLIYDDTRDAFNVTDEALLPNSSSATGGSANAMDIVSNGFKFRSSAGSLNASNYNYIYMAFAKNPFKYANAR
jgi:hypothetical protein